MKKDNEDRKFKINLDTIQNEDGCYQLKLNKVIPSIQLGINDELLKTQSYPPFNTNSNESDIYLMSTIKYDNSNSNTLQKFNFYAYAPHIFDSLRNVFGIDKLEYIKSLCNMPLTGLKNPGASSSKLYYSRDQKFIVKTVQNVEDQYLLNLISKYHEHWKIYGTSLLPKFSGYYGISLNVFSVFNVVTMNNLIPSNIEVHQKFDLKGSTIKRNASKDEKEKPLPTYKDLDFREMYPSGILLKSEIYSNLLNILSNDSNLLERSEIIDYSLLMGIFNIETYLKKKGNDDLSTAAINKWENVMKRATKNSADNYENEYNVSFKDCIPANNLENNRILLFVGIIDVLQGYQLRKNLEYKAKSLLLMLNSSCNENSKGISVQPPNIYRQRFISFMKKYVK